MDILQITDLKKRFGDKEVLIGLMSPDQGQILVAGEKVSFGQTATNRHIGYLPDVPEYYSFMTAREYLVFCGEITCMRRDEIKLRVNELLDLVGLGGEKHRIKGYSRGMKQRLGIAQALLNHPKLLICDEPTSALDPVGRKEILDVLLAVREQTTVLFSTHILSDVERICTDIAFLNQGLIKISGKLSEIKANYRTEKYLIETESEKDIVSIVAVFPDCKRIGQTQMKFSENVHTLFELLQYITNQKIPVLKIERMEPSLESLFMEVVAK